MAVAAGLLVGWPLSELTNRRLDRQLAEMRAAKNCSSTAGVVEAVSKMQSGGLTYTEANTSIPVTAEEIEDAARLDYTDEESIMLMKLAQAEAGNQGVVGKALVMNVVHNRVLSEDFPNTIEEVIFEEGQFTPIQDGHYDSAVPDEECLQALEMVLNYWDGSNGALFFEVTSEEQTWHSANLTFLFEYKDTTFYK